MRKAARVLGLLGVATTLAGALTRGAAHAADSPAEAPPYQTDFPPEEFRARFARVFDGIGAEAAALVQGAPMVRGFVLPRQTNELYYLCGVETPHAYLLLDGRSRRVTLFLPPRNARLERSEGRVLSADDAELARSLTGVDEVLSTDGLRGEGLAARPGGLPAVLHTPFKPSEGWAESRHEIEQANAALANDPLDGRLPREAQLVELLRARLPRTEVRDLTPLLDGLRAVKSPREVALIRRASQLAGHGLLEAMRSTRPGLFEYQLEAAARYVFQTGGARRDGYRAIVAAGTANIWNAHYYRNQGPLRDGDLVLLDFAPDYRYYTSDIARMWPVSGRFSPVQREVLSFVLAYRNAVLKRVRPGITVDEVLQEVKTEMEGVLARTRFSKAIYEDAARKLVSTGGGVFSHPVGMAVHDDGPYRPGPLRSGHVFSIDPQLWVPEEQLYFRYEDVIVVTDKGYENFTDFLPTDLGAIEKEVGRGGILQKGPPPDLR
jgi:Xaa-Pro aminopeptidase